MIKPYVDGHFWRDTSPEWEHIEYGEYSDGKGDLGFNTCDKIVRDNDKSDWAYEALIACMDLLIRGIRWPNRMNQDMDAKNRLECWRSKRKWKRGKVETHKYRWQTGMTRDPYTAFYAACVVLHHSKLIGDVQPMWYNYRPNFWAWWRYLSTKENKYLKRYRFWSWFSTSKLDYVKRLRELREIAIQEI